MAAFVPLRLPVGRAATGNTRAPTAGMLGPAAATDTPTVSDPQALIVAPASGGGDKPREQLDRLLGTVGPERLEPRSAEDGASPVAMVALNMVMVMDRSLHIVFRPAHADRGWMLDPSRKSRAISAP